MKFFQFLIGVSLAGISNGVSDAIPQGLRPCYMGNITLLPMTVTTLIEIIQKIEANPYFIMDMRMLSNALLQRFWRDGIVRDPNVDRQPPDVIPFKTDGFQSYKYKILISKLIPESQGVFPEESLTLEEQCSLHFLLSSSVDPWERADEFIVCPKRTPESIWQVGETMKTKLSSCPIEKGVMYTDYGAVSPSHVIAAIATALAPMSVRQSNIYKSKSSKIRSDKEINNIWASTLAGDLAEMIVMQAPFRHDLYCGPPGRWNDTYIPAIFYMDANPDIVNGNYWQLTDAEMRGSIDGITMAGEVTTWLQLSSFLRLSQLLIMYYKDRGVSFPSTTRACSRRNYLSSKLVFQQRIVEEQTQRFAEVLVDYMPHYFMNDSDFIERYLNSAWSAFLIRSNEIIPRTVSCPNLKKTKPKLRLHVIFDSTWVPYVTQEVIMAISEDIHVSSFGSTIDVISGQLGEVVVKQATSVGDVFLQWQNASKQALDPSGLVLSKALISLNSLLQNTTTDFEYTGAPSPSAHITLVLGLMSPLSEKDIFDSKSLLQVIKNQYPEMRFAYVTQTVTSRSYVLLSGAPSSQSDEILTIDNTKIDNLRKKLQDYLLFVPQSIRPAACFGGRMDTINSTYELYISPDAPNYYEIHPKYLCHSSNGAVTVSNKGYGYLVVCFSREPFKNPHDGFCKDADLNGDVRFSFDSCSYDEYYDINQKWDPDCPPIYLSITGKNSLRRCSEQTCELPDQMRFIMQLQGTRCVLYNAPTCSGIRLKTGAYVVLALSFLCSVFNLL